MKFIVGWSEYQWWTQSTDRAYLKDIFSSRKLLVLEGKKFALNADWVLVFTFTISVEVTMTLILKLTKISVNPQGHCPFEVRRFLFVFLLSFLFPSFRAFCKFLRSSWVSCQILWFLLVFLLLHIWGPSSENLLHAKCFHYLDGFFSVGYFSVLMWEQARINLWIIHRRLKVGIFLLFGMQLKRNQKRQSEVSMVMGQVDCVFVN